MIKVILCIVFLFVFKVNDFAAEFQLPILQEKKQQFTILLEKDANKALLLANEILEIAKKQGGLNDKGLALALVARSERKLGKLEAAEKHFIEGAALLKPVNNESYVEVQLVLARLLIDQARFNEANVEALSALEIAESNNMLNGKAESLALIGLTYDYQDNFQEALEYYQDAKEIYSSINNLKGVGNACNNIGVMYDLMYEFDSAYYYYSKSLEIERQLGNMTGAAGSLNNLALLVMDRKDYHKADSLLQEAMNIYLSYGTSEEVAIAYNNQSNLYFKINDFDKALEAIRLSMVICEEKGLFRQEIDNYKLMSLIYRDLHQFDSAYHYELLHSDGKDSANALMTSRELAEMHEKYENDKKQLEIENLNQENTRVALVAENQQKRITNLWLMAGILLLFGGGAFFMFVLKRRNNRDLEALNGQLSEKNKEILDSIHYAKRIQAAVLPPEKLVKEYLPDSFILYKPKDIVAGDFYWLEHVDDKVLFAACDCTGHGVPGAMVSVVCVNGLNRSVREQGFTVPGKILDNTREVVIREFEKSEEEVKDGMDIALCSLQPSANGYQLQYAGAHNPLWIIRNKDLTEIKADKQPIGKFDNAQSYSTHTVELNKGDTVYIFSDGYADQFGGERVKKFKSSNFKKLLLSIQHETMQRQKELLNESFENWKGDLEQLDDVCVIGVRV